MPSPSQQRTDRPLPASRLPHMPTLPQAQTPMQQASPQLQGVTPPQQPPRPPVYHSQLQAQPHSLFKAPTASTDQARVSLQFPNLHRQAASGSLRLTSHQGLQQTPATTLQLASLPEAHLQAAGAPQDTSCHQKALEKILRNFGPDAGLEAAAMYQALEALVFHLTDPATNAKFFAMLDRQLQPDAERSLGRYYKRVVALRDKHQNEGYAEISRVLQTYLIYLCN